MLTTIVERLVLPPVSLFLLVAAGLLIGRLAHRGSWMRRVGWTAATGGALGVFLTSIPWFAYVLLAPLQTHPAIPPDAIQIDAEAVVVLAGDVDCDPAEWGPDQPGPLSLMRCRYGASLAARTGLPLLITGGVLRPDRRPVSHVLRDFVEQELGIEVTWVEARALSTRQNAEYTAEMLRDEGIRRVAVVTHAWHMPRALESFERAGLEALPAPMGAATSPSPTLAGLVPNMRSFRDTGWAAHEWVGLLWYRWTASPDARGGIRAGR